MIRNARVLLVVLILFSCSKQVRFDRPATLASELQTQANDAVRISTELDALFNDVDSVLGGAAKVCGGDTTVAIDTVGLTRTVSLAFGGNTCDALRSRTGSISILSAEGGDWTRAGDSVTVTFSNIVIKRLADSNTLSFSGSLMYRNLSGGSLAGLAGGNPATVVHTLAGNNITVTYDDGTITRWQFTRQRTYSYSNGLQISTLGLDSAGTIGGVADWGASRFGNSVVVVPTSPLLLSQGCGWRMTGGNETLTNPIGASTLNFGLDSTGNASGCPVNGGRYFFRLAWTADGEIPYSALLPY
jgi:hypothetical protein